MDAVLGLSMTPTSVGLVLVEGNDGDGVTVERDAFEIQHSGDAAAAILGSEALAVSRGLRLKSIGLTWSEDVGAEASMLMKTLSESGFGDIVPVALPEATEALARGIADAFGYRTTAVCAIEPDTVIALIVHNMDTPDGAVHTAFNHTIDSDECLISWLSAVFTRADWQPEALAVVGSAGDFGEVMEGLRDALSVPVFSPAEAELALARGAALASTTTGEFFLPEPYHFADVLTSRASDDQGQRSARHRRKGGRRRRRDTSSLPLAMLVTGSLTFVVSVSMAVAMQLIPDHHVRALPAVAMVQAEQVPAPLPTAVAVIPSAVPTEAAPEAVSPPSELPEPEVEQAPAVDPPPAVSPDPGTAPDGPGSAQTAQQADTTAPAAVPPADTTEPAAAPPQAVETQPATP